MIQSTTIKEISAIGAGREGIRDPSGCCGSHTGSARPVLGRWRHQRLRWLSPAPPPDPRRPRSPARGTQRWPPSAHCTPAPSSRQSWSHHWFNWPPVSWRPLFLRVGEPSRPSGPRGRRWGPPPSSGVRCDTCLLRTVRARASANAPATPGSPPDLRGPL